jgi:glycosyltransferase involved in cell wall biosynthesis
VVVHGLTYFCRRFPAIVQGTGWEVSHQEGQNAAALVALANELRRCDLAFKWGGRITAGKFLAMARFLGKKKVVLFWSGSDVLYAKKQYASNKMSSWIAQRVHWAGAPWLAEEVRSMGLPCEYVPATWVPSVDHPFPLPPRFSVLAYLPDINRVSLYGIDIVVEVARSLPSVNFTIVGLKSGRIPEAPSNVRVSGWTADMSEFYRQATVLWRPVRHDGLSFMALEALAHGRHVLWSYPFPAARLVDGAAAARAALQQLEHQHRRGVLELNEAGIDLIARDFSPDRIRNEILRRWQDILCAPKSRGDTAKKWNRRP